MQKFPWEGFLTGWGLFWCWKDPEKIHALLVHFANKLRFGALGASYAGRQPGSSRIIQIFFGRWGRYQTCLLCHLPFFVSAICLASNPLYSSIFPGVFPRPKQ